MERMKAKSFKHYVSYITYRNGCAVVEVTRADGCMAPKKYETASKGATASAVMTMKHCYKRYSLGLAE